MSNIIFIKFQNCYFFLWGQTNKSKDICNGLYLFNKILGWGPATVPKRHSYTNIFQSSCLYCLYQAFSDILGASIFHTTFRYQLLIVVSFSRYSFPKKLQYIFKAGDYSLRKANMLNISNGNLIVLKWGKHTCYFKCKIYTAIYSKTWPNTLL